MTTHLVVTDDIPFGDPGRGVYAYRAGDRITKEAVEENGWQDFVSGPKTKAAQAATTDKTEGK